MWLCVICPQLNDEEQTDVFKGSGITQPCGCVWVGSLIIETLLVLKTVEWKSVDECVVDVGHLVAKRDNALCCNKPDSCFFSPFIPPDYVFLLSCFWAQQQKTIWHQSCNIVISFSFIQLFLLQILESWENILQLKQLRKKKNNLKNQIYRQHTIWKKVKSCFNTDYFTLYTLAVLCSS